MTEIVKDTTVKNKVILALVLTVVLISVTYIISMQPKPEPGPLILTIDGEEFPDSMFDASYDYTNFDDVEVRFQLLINNEEFSGTLQDEKTVYEFDDWEEAWTVVGDLEIPNIAIGLAKWLRNGTHLEAGERFYGSIEEYDRRAGADGEIGKYLGENIPMSTCTFTVERAQITYPFFADLGPNERIMIAKRYQYTPSRGAPIWIFAVELSDNPPYTAILVKMVRR